jgi:hypothetical protein
MSLFYSYTKCFGNKKIPFLKINNPLEENTIFKLELQADFLESCISFRNIYVGFGTEVWLIPFGTMLY